MDTLIYDGSAVKSLGEDRIGGYLVLFTTKHDTDTSNDYFDADTDFDIEDGEKRSGYYNHGFDVKLGNRKIGVGSVKKDDVGLWLEAQLSERDSYVDAIMEMVKEGALGLSSGALSHLVRREAKNKAGTIHYVKSWPIGEWSLTPTPAEPRTLAMPIKSWQATLPTTSAFQKGMALGECAEASATIAAINDLTQTLMGKLYGCLYGWDMSEDKEPTAAEQIAQVTPMFDEWRDTALRIINALITDEEVSEEAKSLLFSLTRRSKIETPRDFDRLLRDAGFSRKEAKQLTSHGYNSLRDAGETEPITPAELPPPLIDAAAQQTRELKLARMLNRFEGLALTAP